MKKVEKKEMRLPNRMIVMFGFLLSITLFFCFNEPSDIFGESGLLDATSSDVIASADPAPYSFVRKNKKANKMQRELPEQLHVEKEASLEITGGDLDHSIYANHEVRQKTIKQLNNFSRYLSYDRASDLFRKSEADTLENYQESLIRLKKPYGHNPKRGDIEDRVIAIKILNFSAYTEYEDLEGLVDELSAQSQGAGTARSKQKSNIHLDIYELSQTMSRMDRERLGKYMRSHTHDAVMKTLKMGFDYEW